MLLLLSPAKTLDFDSYDKNVQHTLPAFLAESGLLIKELRKLSCADLAGLMKISAKLAELNHQRFADFSTPFTVKNAKPAIFAFKGDVYTGLEAEDFAAAELALAQRRIRIISGLYGLLRPLDLIQPYRLEMGTAFENPRGKNLYEFWGDKITNQLNRELAESESDMVLNLASNEYFSAINPKKIKGRLLNIAFKENKNGVYKVIGIHAKKARGMMARYVVKGKVDNIEKTKKFKEAGYRYNAKMSSPDEMVFAR